MLCHSQNLFGSWVRGQSAGGCRNNSSFPTNPKFWLRVCETSEVCIALLQKQRRYSSDWAGRIQNLTHLAEENLSLSDGVRRKNYQAVGLHVWKVIRGDVFLFANRSLKALLKLLSKIMPSLQQWYDSNVRSLLQLWFMLECSCLSHCAYYLYKLLVD